MLLSLEATHHDKWLFFVNFPPQLGSCQFFILKAMGCLFYINTPPIGNPLALVFTSNNLEKLEDFNIVTFERLSFSFPILFAIHVAIQ
jgi:hypothetical protein